MLKEIQDNVRNKLKSGDSVGAINYLCENVKQFSISDADDIIVARADFLNYKLSYDKNLVSIDDYNIFLNKFNYRLLELIKRLSCNDETGSTSKNKEPTFEARTVLFDKNRVIVALDEFNQIYDIVFVASYTKNTLFVKGKNIKNSTKYNIFNLLSYSKRFPFDIDAGNKLIKYRLDIKFSFYSGLITHFMLIRQDKILLDSEL